MEAKRNFESCEGQQRFLDFVRPDNVTVANIGVNPGVLVNCRTEIQRKLLTAESII